MVDFFESVASFFTSIIELIEGLISGLVQALGYVASSTVLVTTITGWMPTFAAGCVLAVFGIAVAKFIVGR